MRVFGGRNPDFSRLPGVSGVEFMPLIPYLASALSLIVALIAFKAARRLYLDALDLAVQVEGKRLLIDVNEIRDEIAVLADAVDRNREIIAKMQGRQGGRPRKDETPASTADVKRQLRAQLGLNGVKHGGPN